MLKNREMDPLNLVFPPLLFLKSKGVARLLLIPAARGFNCSYQLWYLSSGKGPTTRELYLVASTPFGKNLYLYKFLSVQQCVLQARGFFSLCVLLLVRVFFVFTTWYIRGGVPEVTRKRKRKKGRPPPLFFPLYFQDKRMWCFSVYDKNLNS